MKTRLVVVGLLFFLASFFIPISFSSELITHANSAVVCNPGFSGGSPIEGLPTYDYGSDGLVRFHFLVDQSGWSNTNLYYFHYDDNCNYQGAYGYTYNGQAHIPPGVTHLMMKAQQSAPNTFTFTAIDEDTGQSVDVGPGPLEPIQSSIVSIGFVQFFWYGQFGAQTPAVPAINPNSKDQQSKNPVLIVPGLLGTNLDKNSERLWLNFSKMTTDIGDDFMDPLAFTASLQPTDSLVGPTDILAKQEFLNKTVFDYTDGLVEEFKSQGYTQGSGPDARLFTFPYDWRYGASGNINGSTTVVSLLKQKIDSILSQTGSQKVDIIAHSTGGLLVKKYVQDYPNDHHIGKAIFVGVPNLGAPKAAKVLLQGDNFGIPTLADSEMKKLAKNLPVTYDLAPSQKYISDIGSYIKTISSTSSGVVIDNLDYPATNNYLKKEHMGNGQGLTNAQALHSTEYDTLDFRKYGIDPYSIVGCKAGTLGSIVEYRNSSGHEIFDPGFRLEETTGDGTVPLGSASAFPVAQDHLFYALKPVHAKMLSADGTRQEIVNLITGSTLATGNTILTQQEVQDNPTRCQLKGHWLQIFSPLAISITDQSGNVSDVADDGSVENNIPGADYGLMGEHKFVFLPDDENQMYTINVKGMGTGVFTLKDTSINNGVLGNTQIFKNIPVTTKTTGSLVLGDEPVLALDTNADGVIDQQLHPSASLTPEQVDDLTAPTITIRQPVNKNYFQKEQFTVDFSCEDPSGIQSCTGTLANGSVVTNDSIGPKTFIVTAVDKVGNVATSTVSYDVFAFQGLLDRKVVKKGSTVPVKFKYSDGTGKFANMGTARLYINPTAPGEDGLSANVHNDDLPNNTFRYEDGQYILNMSTVVPNIFSSGQTYSLRIIVEGDPVVDHDYMQAFTIK